MLFSCCLSKFYREHIPHRLSVKQYLLYPTLHSFEFPRAFLKQRILALSGSSHRLRLLSFGLVLKDCRPQDTCKNSRFTIGVSRYLNFSTLFVRFQVIDSHKANTRRRIIRNSLVKLLENRKFHHNKYHTVQRVMK